MEIKSVVVQSVKSSVEEGNDAITQSIVLPTESTMADTITNVTVTVYVQQMPVNVSEFIGMMNFWLDCVMLVLSVLVLLGALVGIVLSVFGWKNYKDYKTWISGVNQSIDARIDARINKGYDVLQQRVAPATYESSLVNRKKGE